MAFLFEPSDPSTEAAFRRVAVEQLDKALAEAECGVSEAAKAIHGVRKRCKRLRGLLRLVRHSFPDYRRENAAVRDVAAGLSSLRDADVLSATLDKVVGGFADGLDPQAIERLRETLGDRGHRAKAETDVPAALAEFRRAVGVIRERADDWTLNADGFDAMAPGLAQVYRQARRDLKLIRREPSAETFHDWRKQVKYHWHHLCLLRGCAPHVLTGQRDLANDLAETLGDHHDTHVFLQVLDSEPSHFSGIEGLDAVRQAVERRQDALGADALRLGYELTAERTACLVERLESYWRNGRRLGAKEFGSGDRAQVSRAA
ncbi:MAG TPA: CHAD domain-containing protein [Mesorhizobium sp.]|jgi:CHAD domain-containing protein|nr:CHAD domain-containing protein [Mesorhizobium sp.]